MVASYRPRSCVTGPILVGAMAVVAASIQAVHSRCEVTAVWMGHRQPQPDELTISWTTDHPEPSRVTYQEGNVWREIHDPQPTMWHRLQIPLSDPTRPCPIRVFSGVTTTEVLFPGYPADGLRIAVVANWQSRPDLSAILANKPHLLLSAGDHVNNLHSACGPGHAECVEPFLQLIRQYPELFRRVPVLPVLGNHDREIRPRTTRPPEEPVYDIEARAFRRVFALPDAGWYWHFALPQSGLCIVGLDLNHIGDRGTTWQSCHDFGPDSEQFKWYKRIVTENTMPFLITLHNEQNITMRSQYGGLWEQLFQKNTAIISGFGHFGECAVKDNVAYFNTSLQGKGDRYPDPRSEFLASEHNYLLMTINREPLSMIVQLKSLHGPTLYTWLGMVRTGGGNSR
ncbi:metallophosphoesterase family protein [Thermogutta sp.]|uniref:metallophosphoesterase family protein n=1 Tax=Thermogutta sp. TaxID=1962930 RepID=UPI003C7C3F26